MGSVFEENGGEIMFIIICALAVGAVNRLLKKPLLFNENVTRSIICTIVCVLIYVGRRLPSIIEYVGWWSFAIWLIPFYYAFFIYPSQSDESNETSADDTDTGRIARKEDKPTAKRSSKNKKNSSQKGSQSKDSKKAKKMPPVVDPRMALLVLVFLEPILEIIIILNRALGYSVGVLWILSACYWLVQTFKREKEADESE